MFTKRLLTTMVVASGLGVGVMGSALAQPMLPPAPPHHGPGCFGPAAGPFAMIFHGIKLTPEQKKKVHAILKDARDNEHAQHQSMDALHEQIADALLAPGKVTEESLKPLLDKQAAAEQATKDSHLKTVLALRDVLTPAQLAQAKASYTKMKDLRGQMKQLQKQMHEAAGPGSDAPPPPPPGDAE